MADFSKWNRDNLEKVASEMLARLVRKPNDEAELLNLLLMRANIRQQAKAVESEQRWADHYYSRLMHARALGFLPEDFEF